ncbi:hypothetical protein, conserved [Eimeria acervulina]|uniref:Protein kinase domain-containing protein n=1 Tax=Eimeria acervulina TaxID=5801 RepID=U6GN10_EIMAC|nr:hypothetical protein, conserved [Eimeria acervulina]CDI80668.1 hypothetical protein, conserved [Eimeria acervulina]
MSPSQRMGKNLLGLAVQHRKQMPPTPPGRLAKEVMQTLAQNLSNGVSKDLVGMQLSLTNMQALGFPDIDKTSRKFAVTNYLGEGGHFVTVEVVEEGSSKKQAMKLFTLTTGSRVKLGFLGRQLARATGIERILDETTAMLQAAGNTKLSEAMASRGLLLASGVASIQGVPSVMECPSAYLINEVILMDSLSGDLLGLFAARNPLPLEIKEYAAKRVLLIAMHLQRANFSHNNFSLENIFAREDGSFFLGEFGAGTPIGKPLERVRDVTVKYADKDLAAAAMEGRRTAQVVRPIADGKSDMWALGMCLYGIFTGGRRPYGLANSEKAAEELQALAREKVDAKALRKQLSAAKVPLNWQGLIVDLLQVERANRSDVVTLIGKYVDLIY